MMDEDFDMCDHDENYIPLSGASSSQGNKEIEIIHVMGMKIKI
jgi:hypothetical protein